MPFFDDGSVWNTPNSSNFQGESIFVFQPLLPGRSKSASGRHHWHRWVELPGCVKVRSTTCCIKWYHAWIARAAIFATQNGQMRCKCRVVAQESTFPTLLPFTWSRSDPIQHRFLPRVQVVHHHRNSLAYSRYEVCPITGSTRIRWSNDISACFFLSAFFFKKMKGHPTTRIPKSLAPQLSHCYNSVSRSSFVKWFAKVESWCFQPFQRIDQRGLLTPSVAPNTAIRRCAQRRIQRHWTPPGPAPLRRLAR